MGRNTQERNCSPEEPWNALNDQDLFQAIVRQRFILCIDCQPSCARHLWQGEYHKNPNATKVADGFVGGGSHCLLK
jgi:hypothetical protein